eukprot:gene3269-biopygen661
MNSFPMRLVTAAQGGSDVLFCRRPRHGALHRCWPRLTAPDEFPRAFPSLLQRASTCICARFGRPWAAKAAQNDSQMSLRCLSAVPTGTSRLAGVFRALFRPGGTLFCAGAPVTEHCTGVGRASPPPMSFPEHSRGFSDVSQSPSVTLTLLQGASTRICARFGRPWAAKVMYPPVWPALRGGVCGTLATLGGGWDSPRASTDNGPRCRRARRARGGGGRGGQGFLAVQHRSNIPSALSRAMVWKGRLQ